MISVRAQLSILGLLFLGAIVNLLLMRRIPPPSYPEDDEQDLPTT